jgi:hypothetical protein
MLHGGRNDVQKHGPPAAVSRDNPVLVAEFGRDLTAKRRPHGRLFAVCGTKNNSDETAAGLP